jgi:hypothetical protein
VPAVSVDHLTSPIKSYQGTEAVRNVAPVIEPGTTRFTFPVLTRYGGCLMVDGKPCTPPPLPPGAYFAVLIGDGSVPLPPAATAATVVGS